MSQTQSKFNQYRALIAACQEYLNTAEIRTVLTDSDTYNYFSRFLEPKKHQVVTPKKMSTPIKSKIAQTATPPVRPPVSATPQPVIIEERPAVPVAIPVKSKPEPTQQETAPNPITIPMHKATLPSFLPKSSFAIKTAPIQFSGMASKLQKILPTLSLNELPPSDLEAREIINQWKKEYPTIAILAFLEPNSQQLLFLNIVVQAINSRLAKTALYLHPPRSLLGELYTLAEIGHLTTILAVTDTSDMSKIGHFFSDLDMQEASQHKNLQLLHSRGMLFTAKLFNFIITDSLQTDPEKKTILWKELRQIIL